MKARPYQDRYHEANRLAVKRGLKAWNNQAPCGAGKTFIMMRLAMNAVSRGKRVAIYCCRNQALANVRKYLHQNNIPHGMVSAEYPSELDQSASLQLCSLQTVASRIGDFRHDFPFADIVLVDESHQQVGEQASKVFAKHEEGGCIARIGFTATPVNLGGLYEDNLSCVTFKELIDYKAHLPADYYGPDRPDLSQLRTNASGEFSTSANEEINAVPKIFCRVLEWYNKLNPQRLPAICFGASVAHSRGLVYEFARNGITAAHIDGERVLMTRNVGGNSLDVIEAESTVDTRDQIIQGSKDGTFQVVCNRFVLRESVDMPWLYHAIIACSMGGISTYLQSVGRVIRYWPSYDRVIIQDHGGNIDRHGLVNEEDREWRLGDTNKTIHKRNVEKRRETKGNEAEPICCPKCSGMRLSGPKCPYCGHMHTRSVKFIRQLDGKMVRKVGRDEKYRRPKTFDDYFRSALYGSYRAGGTVSQAYSVARARAKQDGIQEIRPERIWVPSDGDSRWGMSTREVYPSFKPKGM